MLCVHGVAYARKVAARAMCVMWRHQKDDREYCDSNLRLQQVAGLAVMHFGDTPIANTVTHLLYHYGTYIRILRIHSSISPDMIIQ